MASSKSKQGRIENMVKEKAKRIGDHRRSKPSSNKSPPPSAAAAGSSWLVGKKGVFAGSLVVVASVGVYVLLHYTSLLALLGDPTVTLASADVAVSDRLRFTVPCSDDYQQEQFEECKPKRCGRAVSDSLVTNEDAEHLLRLAKRGLALGGSRGGASILDLHSGALSLGDSFVNIYKVAKSEVSLFSEEDFHVYRKVKNQIHEAVAEEFGVPAHRLFLTKPTFFSRMDTSPPHTVHDEYWHVHVDKETYGSFHYTSLLYLTTYGKDFKGGRFIFTDSDGKNRTVEPRLGRVSFFTSGAENPHCVERLTEGVRYAITVAFTCDPSQAISDPALK